MPVSITSLGRNLRVGWVDFYGDGTMTATILDDAGRSTTVCFDGRVNSPTRHRLYQHARHPRQEGAVLVELGELEEGIVVSLLSHWLDSVEAKGHLTERGWESARDTLLQVGASTI